MSSFPRIDLTAASRLTSLIRSVVEASRSGVRIGETATFCLVLNSPEQEFRESSPTIHSRRYAGRNSDFTSRRRALSINKRKRAHSKGQADRTSLKSEVNLTNRPLLVNA